MDDDPDVRELIAMSMSVVGGWLVVEATGGLEAVEIARRRRPDLVVLDVTMPEVDGIATFHLLQQDPLTAGVPVVLLTAAQRVGVQSWFGLDVAGVLAKPFDPIQLPVLVEALLLDRGQAMAQEA
ncbi:response regulator [Nocardioides sp. AX2bis]|uniref:response regulator n=1 Tax=Nocardioides sp. AX2bis TaxID=2653157 RepID=UPI0019152F0E|nr:response regulator [Nocardioides sp. AX2bis]